MIDLCLGPALLEGELGGLRARVNGPPAGVAAKGKGSPKGEDVRALAVDYDAQDRPFKPWREVVAEMTRWPFFHWPLDAPPTALHFCARVERIGRAPAGWLEDEISIWPDHFRKTVA